MLRAQEHISTKNLGPTPSFVDVPTSVFGVL
jgi:hypothetical protein